MPADRRPNPARRPRLVAAHAAATVPTAHAAATVPTAHAAAALTTACAPAALASGSTVFRTAKYTSHEVTVDDEQLAWFERLVSEHPSEEGWKVFVFTHAPPIGSGLRVLQENHVVNGCCWLNHSGGKNGDPRTTTKFIELVRRHRCIKAWFSGHFHLGQDYQDSITFPTIPREEGPYPNRGSCVFAQTSVMRAGTSRDTRQQSRLLRGNKDGSEICAASHEKRRREDPRLPASRTASRSAPSTTPRVNGVAGLEPPIADR